MVILRSRVELFSCCTTDCYFARVITHLAQFSVKATFWQRKRTSVSTSRPYSTVVDGDSIKVARLQDCYDEHALSIELGTYRAIDEHVNVAGYRIRVVGVDGIHEEGSIAPAVLVKLYATGNACEVGQQCV